MPERRTIEARLRSVEEALSTDDRSTATLGATDGQQTAAFEDRLTAIEDRIAELEAGLQAVRGYVGQVDHVNQRVEQRANAAVAAVERIESAPRTPPRLAMAQRAPESDSASEPVRDAASTPDGEGREQTDTDGGSTSLVGRLTGLV